MDVCEPNDVHADRTRRSRFSYCFTPKHHGAGSRDDARWLPDLPRAEEFGIFDEADRQELSDEDGNLYGLRIRSTGDRREILELGTRQERIARFWAEPNQAPWHGHPLWPVITKDALNRKSWKYQPPKAVFDRMVQVGILSETQALRLKTARHLRNL